MRNIDVEENMTDFDTSKSFTRSHTTIQVKSIRGHVDRKSVTILVWLYDYNRAYISQRFADIILASDEIYAACSINQH
jgi:hypothetical protein